MLLRVDADSARPLYDQVAASIRADILAGALAPGDRLPPARDVAGALEINQHTVLHAYQRLRDEGLIDLRRGRGAVIAASAAPLAELAHDIDVLVRKAAALGVSAEMLAGIVHSHRGDRTDHRTPEENQEVSP
ncbi:GntR family transcriptional regulator [Microbacterium sp. MYb72]|uniref:GntR family transcriptional regulator n=1 Tax=Microbacterium sp. MYb72 TaxID=1848693 RepID=UPI000CFC1167|nr:GntR family transcriptional regulator [Microbacterium sp. MYb72]PRB12426.1 GntR family transcriptional regulator [Microbacterium sp. MYb72]